MSTLTKVLSKGPALVLYHAHWCHHCVDFIKTGGKNSEWEKTKRLIKKALPNLTICEVEDSQMNAPAFPDVYKVSAFPMIKCYLYANSAGVEFHGMSRTAPAICDFVVTQLHNIAIPTPKTKTVTSKSVKTVKTKTPTKTTAATVSSPKKPTKKPTMRGGCGPDMCTAP